MEEFEIRFAPSAEEDLMSITKWLSEEAPDKREEWLSCLKKRIEDLKSFPNRCAHAPENGLWGKEELRQLIFKDYPSTFRVIFCLKEKSKIVQVLNVRHGARRYLYEAP